MMISRDAMRSYYVDYFCAQVRNGGFSQFVYNSRWSANVVSFVHEGLSAMRVTRQLKLFQAGATFVERSGASWLQRFLATDYFGDNVMRDSFNDAVPMRVTDGVPEANAAWLRSLPNLVVATIDEMRAEATRRGAVLPDRDARIANARAKEPRDLRLIRALCERSGHAYARRTAASLVRYGREDVWAFYFLTDRGPHYMIDLGTKAMMFPATSDKVVDAGALVAEIDCEPAAG